MLGRSLFLALGWMIGAPFAAPAQAPTLVDSTALAAYADSTGVPRYVLMAVAWEESRSGARGNRYVGPGVRQVDTTTGAERRVCRERGRMQHNPCFHWRQPPVARCAWARVRDNYADNVWCAGLKLHMLYAQYGSWATAIERYNGRGPRARAYRERALATIARFYLAEVQHGQD